MTCVHELTEVTMLGMEVAARLSSLPSASRTIRLPLLKTTWSTFERTRSHVTSFVRSAST